MASVDWMNDALCSQVGYDLFFPDSETNPASALSVCRKCPARLDCLQYALDYKIMFGIWGGTTPTDRRKLRRAA